MVVGMSNTFAALASPTTLFFRTWRSIDCTPKAICGCWSMKMTCEFWGVRTSSFGLDKGVSLGSLRREGSGDELRRHMPEAIGVFGIQCIRCDAAAEIGGALVDRVRLVAVLEVPAAHAAHPGGRGEEDRGRGALLRCLAA